MSERKIVDIEEIELIVPESIKLSKIRKKLMTEFIDVELESDGSTIIISFDDELGEIDIENNKITFVEFEERGLLEDYFNLLKIGEVFVEIDIYVL